MKRIPALSLLLWLTVLLLPRAAGLLGAAGELPLLESTALLTEPDNESTVRVLDGQQVRSMSVFEYLTGVVSAEMPAAFEPEALKAQAVAARSYLRCALADPRHDNADICTSADCCQAYLSAESLKQSWGEKYDACAEKIASAVSATDGEYLSYGGEPALAAFHSSSAGMTENSAALWSDVPYLVSVSSPETEETVPNFVSRAEFSDIDFRDTVLSLEPTADMTGDGDTWIGACRRSDSGRVEALTVGGVEIDGARLRTAFSLRSTNFDISHETGKFVFTVRGYGHGIGMSQYGADAMARDGADYREILAHYYPGTTLECRRA